MMKNIFILLAVVTFVFNAAAETQTLNFVPPASNELQQGFVRLQNNNSDAVTVSITGIDDAGKSGDSEISLTIPAGASKHLNSNDLEQGNLTKGLTGAFGDGVGNWRLLVTTQESIKVSAYIRTSEGFLTQVDSTTDSHYGTVHNVPIFNPASNTNQVSKLRIVNDSNSNNAFVVSGVDDNGASTDSVTFSLSPYSSIELTSQDLENGNAEKGLQGAIGDGKGKWSLNIYSSKPAIIMNLLEAPGGYLSNLSTIANKKASFSNLTCADLDGARIYSTQEPPTYLGFLGGKFALDSVNNSIGTYGSEFAVNGIRNELSSFGSEFGLLSHANKNSINPPVVVKNGVTLMYLSSNTTISGAISLATLDSICSFTSASANNTFATPK